MKVVVGSTNPAKIKAVREAFRKVYPDELLEVKGKSVPSGVSDQPMSEKESMRGAQNRAERALAAEEAANFAVGLEGGLQEVEGHWFDCGWIVVRNRKGEEGLGSTLRMEVTRKMMSYIQQGMELGKVDDLLFGKQNSKHGQGYFGLMTSGAITRSNGYRDGVISALTRFLHPDLFEVE